MLSAGKYAIYLQFEGGRRGVFMAIEDKRSYDPWVSITDSFYNAEKFISQNSAEKYFFNNNLGDLRDSNGDRVTDAWVYKDGKFLHF